MIAIGTDIARVSRFSDLSRKVEEGIFTPFEIEEAGKRIKRGSIFPHALPQRRLM